MGAQAASANIRELPSLQNMLKDDFINFPAQSSSSVSSTRRIRELPPLKAGEISNRSNNKK